MKQLKQLEMLIDFSIEAEQREIVDETGCSIPCNYKEYIMVGDPWSGSNLAFNSDDERFKRLFKIFFLCFLKIR